MTLLLSMLDRFEQADDDMPKTISCGSETRGNICLTHVLWCPTWLRSRFERDDSFNSWLLQEAEDRDEYERGQKADADREERMLQP